MEYIKQLLDSAAANSEITVAIIEGLFNVVTALIPSVTVYFASKNLMKLKNSVITALTALRELSYMRELYSEACNRLSAHEEGTLRKADLAIRSDLAKLGIKSENKLPPSEIERRTKVYEEASKKSFSVPNV